MAAAKKPKAPGREYVAAQRLYDAWAKDLRSRGKTLAAFSDVMDGWSDFITWLNTRCRNDAKLATETADGGPAGDSAAAYAHYEADLYRELLRHTMPYFETFQAVYWSRRSEERKATEQMKMDGADPFATGGGGPP